MKTIAPTIAPITLSQLDSVQLPLINKFYQAHKVRGRAKRSDQLWVAKSDSQIVAALRLTPSSKNPDSPGSFPLLCGVFVAEDFRHQSIASRLITKAVASERITYTFAYRHLTLFYQSLGFSRVSQQQLSASLSGRFHTYTRQGRDIIPMCFTATPVGGMDDMSR